MIAIKILLAIIFAFLLFIGAFVAISTWIFDKVEISDHTERMKLQKIRAHRNEEKQQKRGRIY